MLQREVSSLDKVLTDIKKVTDELEKTNSLAIGALEAEISHIKCDDAWMSKQDEIEIYTLEKPATLADSIRQIR